MQKNLIRPFVSAMTTLTFLAMAFSGCILYVTPPGRVANWTNWRMLGLLKDQWADLHICFSLVFIIFSIVHLVLNFKALLSYCKSRMTGKFTLRPCWLGSVIVCVFIGYGALMAWPPFSQVLELNAKIKYSWEKPSQAAPIPHAEKMTIAELADKARLNIDEIMDNLQFAGFIVTDPDVIFGDLAAANQISASELYNIATANFAGKSVTPQSGMGRMTLEELCQHSNINLEKAIENLQKHNVQATGQTRIRNIANELEIRPSEVIRFISE